MQNESDSVIVFEGKGDPVYVSFTESELVYSYRLIQPTILGNYWRVVAFVDGKWLYPIYRNYGIPNG